MTDEALAQFAEALAREIDDARDDPSNALPSSEGVFTRLVLEQLEDVGHFEGAFDLHQEGRVGRSPFRISGYAIDDEAGSLTLFATHYSGTLPPPRVSASELTKTTEHALAYLAACLGGLADRIEPSNTEASDLARRVGELGRRIDRLKVVVLTDGIAASHQLPPKIDGGARRVDFELYDIMRLYRVLGQGQTRADIDVDLVALAGARVPCLSVVGGGERYEAFLAAFPGETLSRIYDRYGTRLLELNVRAFLGLSGRKSVNAELRRTLIDQPEMFFAFNNGIVATADEVRLEQEGGATFLIGLRGLQLVNGGQTTASLHRARRKDGAALDGVEVPVKIIKAPSDLEEMVASISRAANRQNTVQQADFSANDPFHQEVETLANNTWLESGRGRWFYERARGSYIAAEQKAAYRASEKRAFLEQTPKSRRISKLDLARYLSAWDGLPWRVALGGQKNFQAYMQRRKETSAPAPDAAWFRRLIALTIIYRATEQVVREIRFPAYGANILAYLVAAIGDRTGGRIDFELVWRQQRASMELLALIRAWAPEIDAALRASVGSRNPTEWFKKEDCWIDMRHRLPSFSDPLPPELLGASSAKTNAGGSRDKLGAADYDRIEECMRVPAAEWIAAAEAGQKDGILHYTVAGICMTLANYASSGWTRRPSIKQAKHGLDALAKVRSASLPAQ